MARGVWLQRQAAGDTAVAARCAPLALAEVAYAVVAAVFVDSVGDFGAAWSVAARILRSMTAV